MKKLFGNCSLVFTALLFASTAARGEQFGIQPGDVISQNVPGPGAGLIDVNTGNDLYTFSATAGQLIYLEELAVAATFQGWLQWNITGPGNVVVFSGFFNGTTKGRVALPSTGAYTVKFWVGSVNAALIGAYSFRLRPIPADQSFAITIGSTISNAVPAAGAGNLEVPGANDLYTFTATNGQSVFFEEGTAAPAFAGWLQWILKSPSSNNVFTSFFDSTSPGRVTLPETGTYSLRLQVGSSNTNYVGSYWFKVRNIPADDMFAIQVGDTVANSSPAAGAGNIETAGAFDRYTFTGTAGQEVFFDNISAAASLGGWLKWEVLTPTGQSLFATFLTGASVGKKTLPETGTYKINCWVAANNPAFIGDYSFRLRAVESSQFAINIGDQVSDAVPASGAGRIETAGGQDTYTFQGTAGQKVMFKQINAAAAFAGWLSWEVKAPAGSNWFTRFFQNGFTECRVLPQSGTYTVRVFAAANNPAYFGTYAFKTWSDVYAGPDKLATLPGAPLVIPKGSMMCNDLAEPGDAPTIELPTATSVNGGVVTQTLNSVNYIPPAGFVGTDTFQYKLRGIFGGESNAVVTVNVQPGADRGAAVLSLSRSGPAAVSLCLLGVPGQSYAIEESTNLVQWTFKSNIVASANGAMNYAYYTTNGPVRYYRFRKP